MKKWLRTIKKTIRSSRGEMIIETVVSLLILAILLGAVTGMIQTSLRLTGEWTREATLAQQETFNPTVMELYDDDAIEISFTAAPILGAGGVVVVPVPPAAAGLVDAAHDVIPRWNEEDGIFAFTPDNN